MKKVLLFIRIFFSTFFGYMLGLILTIILSIVTLLCVILRLQGAHRYLHWAWGFFSFLFAGKIIHYRGLENIQTGKAYLVVSNHGSMLDILALCTILRGHPAWVAKKSLLKVPLFGWALGNFIIPIDRASLFNSSRALEKETLNQMKGRKRWVFIFPEGTRTLDGRLQEFKRGFIKLLRGSNLDLLPVTLNGFYTMKPRNSQFYLNPSPKLEIVIHSPVSNETLSKMDDKTIVQITQDTIAGAYKVPPPIGVSKKSVELKHT